MVQEKNKTQAQKADQYLIKAYNRKPVSLCRGEGVYLFDEEGNAYLDFASGFGVCGLGYGNKELEEALAAQAGRLIHTSNLYYHTNLGPAAEALCRACGMDKVFFTNSGTESNEGALKAARKYAWSRKNGRSRIIAMEHSFHGRSIGALSVTGNEDYQKPFAPLMDGVDFAKFNDLEDVKSKVTDSTCAVIVEPIQGEGGIYPADKEFLQGLRRLCDENDMLLIFDEVQCGMGRTGHMFAWQYYDVKPDIMTMAKAIGNGVPVGAFAMTDKVAGYALVPGDHGSTYGGNPLACMAVKTVVGLYEEKNIVSHVREMEKILQDELDRLVERFDFITERRGVGLMQGLVLDGKISAGAVNMEAFARGLLILTAEGNVVRLLPPLIIEKEDVEKMISVLSDSLQAVKDMIL